MKFAKRLMMASLISFSFINLAQATEVGRLFRVFDTSETAQADVMPSHKPIEATPAAAPDKESLAAIMKHPTEPHYDQLMPMSGRWVRCQASAGNPTSGSTQDRFSSTDRTHFTHVTAKASDGECKVIVSERRNSYECESMNKETLACKLTKVETKTGEADYVLMKQTESELAGSTLKLSLKLSGQKKKKSELDTRKLEVRIVNDSSDEGAETYALTFASKK